MGQDQEDDTCGNEEGDEGVHAADFVGDRCPKEASDAVADGGPGNQGGS